MSWGSVPSPSDRTRGTGLNLDFSLLLYDISALHEDMEVIFKNADVFEGKKITRGTTACMI